MKHTENTKKDGVIITEVSLEPFSESFDYWFGRHNYYHQHVLSFYKSIVPHGMRVLHVQCKNGYVLEEVADKYKGVGVEYDDQTRTVAAKRYSQYQFYKEINQIPFQTFDYILLSFATMEADDIYELFCLLRTYCHRDTRIIVETYRSLWSPLLWIAQRLGLKRSVYYKNWLNSRDMATFFHVANFEEVTSGGYMLMPFYIPFLSWFFNTIIAHMPLLNRLCLHQWTMIRPRKKIGKKDASVSVIIPCRNERGNIEAAINRMPLLGKNLEFIFVEGYSRDGTLDEIISMQNKYSDKNIRWFEQEGKGKGDAVRKGFSEAKGEILIILDADLTMPPEELYKFYDILVHGYADFINGSRLIYAMESQSMGRIAWLANRFFGWIISWIIGQPVSDTLCGTKVLWKKDYHAIAANRDMLGLWDPFGDFDLLFGAAKQNLKIIDIPIHYKRRTYGKTNIFHYKEVWFLFGMCARAWAILRARI